MSDQPLSESQLQALLRIKRFEQPPPGYFSGLLDRVQRRQREELLRRPAWHIALERIRAFFAPLHLDLRHATAMAALLVAGILAIRVAIPERAPGPVHSAVAYAGSPLAAAAGPVLTLQPASAPSIATQEEHRAPRDPDAPVRFIIDTQPVSYEATQIRF